MLAQPSIPHDFVALLGFPSNTVATRTVRWQSQCYRHSKQQPPLRATCNSLHRKSRRRLNSIGGLSNQEYHQQMRMQICVPKRPIDPVATGRALFRIRRELQLCYPNSSLLCRHHDAHTHSPRMTHTRPGSKPVQRDLECPLKPHIDLRDPEPRARALFPYFRSSMAVIHIACWRHRARLRSMLLRRLHGFRIRFLRKGQCQRLAELSDVTQQGGVLRVRAQLPEILALESCTVALTAEQY